MAGDEHAARMAGRQVRAVMPQKRFQSFGLFGRNVAGTAGARPLQEKGCFRSVLFGVMMRWRVVCAGTVNRRCNAVAWTVGPCMRIPVRRFGR